MSCEEGGDMTRSPSRPPEIDEKSSSSLDPAAATSNHVMQEITSQIDSGAIVKNESEEERDNDASGQDEDTVMSNFTHGTQACPSAMADDHVLGSQGSTRQSQSSFTSCVSEHSGMPSPSSKATTPVAFSANNTGIGEKVQSSTQSNSSQALSSPEVTENDPAPRQREVFDVKARASIPQDIAPEDFAYMCIEAAEQSRLNPYALHPGEYQLLRTHLTKAQVSTYLQLRNATLRLWLSNPRMAVSIEEAIGCARDPRWFSVASVCYHWLLRNGYINYGCCETHATENEGIAMSTRKTIVIVGAGMSGIGCARHLETLFQQYAARFREMEQEPPRVIVVEGRSRIGGRIYSRALDTSQCQHMFGFQGQRHTVECGGMIITGFDRGNPLNVLVRGQLALPYYTLRPETTLFDFNGKPVNLDRDQLVEKLYNDCLERVSDYKFRIAPSKLIEGNREIIDHGKESTSEGQKTIAQVEEAAATLPQAVPVAQQSLAPEVKLVPTSTDRTTGKTHGEPGTPTAQPAAFRAKQMGWVLKEGVAEYQDLKLDGHARATNASLGALMDEAINQYVKMIDITSQELRLMNWHIANLEYSNATNYHQLSLGGWDLDAGNEWEGPHTMVVGGYQLVPWGISQYPNRLDIRKESPVTRINYDPTAPGAAKVECENGMSFNADLVVSTLPLGVLKYGNVEFDPPLPPWKTDAIQRLGYGVLNKVILVYQGSFWDKRRDIFGVLRMPTSRNSTRQSDYASQRGRFFQWFDVSNTSGVPTLMALMAGDAGFDIANTNNDELVSEATHVLRHVFGAKVPMPIHAVVTRWGADKFSRGSYSSAGPNMRPEDYDTMARSIGNLFFAGEHTTGTHPATVHGAYLSGLRAASEILESLLGPIEIPVPLIPPKEVQVSSVGRAKRRASNTATQPTSFRASKQARIDAHEEAMWQHTVSQIGERPRRPPKVTANTYLLFSKANIEAARKRCAEELRPTGRGRPTPKNEVHFMASKMWKEATPEMRRPFQEQAAQQKKEHVEKVKQWEEEVQEWDRKSLEVKAAWESAGNRLVLEETKADSPTGRERRSQRISTYAESESGGSEIG